MEQDVAAVRGYHQRTKHHPYRFARSLGYLDWDTQPDPFRRYAGAPLVSLDQIPVGSAPSLDAVYRPARQPVRPLDRAAVSQLFQDALALSAWKEFEGSRWSLRSNPSSGNLHPTEAYLVAGAIPGLTAVPGLFHYAPHEHALEERARLAPDAVADLLATLPAGAFLVGLTSIHWRESWKYGERAWRYCQHDAGHAIAGVAYAAAALGWSVRLLPAVADATLARLLRVDDQDGIEAEHPDALLAVFPAGAPPPDAATWTIADPLLVRLGAGPARGQPNALSSEHHPWPVIDEIAAACRHDGRLPQGFVVPPPTGPAEPTARDTVSARHVFRTRRSAVAMDGRTAIPRETFERMLRRLLPGPEAVPAAVLPWRSAIHPLLFVHRVDGLAPGLYVLPREAAAAEPLRAACRAEFAWESPAGWPDDVPLRLLQPGDCRSVAQVASCQQEIAAAGAFAVAFLADFTDRLDAAGAWFYRALHFEAGLLGHILYLEAEAAGVRGTGIGCFFDDVVHDLLGIRDGRFQTLYHFTLGGPVEDARLRTAPAYAHLSGLLDHSSLDGSTSTSSAEPPAPPR